MPVNSYWIAYLYCTCNMLTPGRRHQVTQLVDLVQVPEPSLWSKASKRYRLCNTRVSFQPIRRLIWSLILVPGKKCPETVGAHFMWALRCAQTFSLIPISGYSFWHELSLALVSPNRSVTHDCLFSSLLDIDCLWCEMVELTSMLQPLAPPGLLLVLPYR